MSTAGVYLSSTAFQGKPDASAASRSPRLARRGVLELTHAPTPPEAASRCACVHIWSNPRAKGPPPAHAKFLFPSPPLQLAFDASCSDAAESITVVLAYALQVSTQMASDGMPCAFCPATARSEFGTVAGASEGGADYEGCCGWHRLVFVGNCTGRVTTW